MGRSSMSSLKVALLSLALCLLLSFVSECDGKPKPKVFLAEIEDKEENADYNYQPTKGYATPITRGYGPTTTRARGYAPTTTPTTTRGYAAPTTKGFGFVFDDYGYVPTKGYAPKTTRGYGPTTTPTTTRGYAAPTTRGYGAPTTKGFGF